ncbi:Uncharacterised protein [Orientia tsutsugamushi]|nr:Uncharacterised protein [Orientia tsutsugamushi]
MLVNAATKIGKMIIQNKTIPICSVMTLIQKN